MDNDTRQQMLDDLAARINIANGAYVVRDGADLERIVQATFGRMRQHVEALMSAFQQYDQRKRRKRLRYTPRADTITVKEQDAERDVWYRWGIVDYPNGERHHIGAHSRKYGQQFAIWHRERRRLKRWQERGER